MNKPDILKTLKARSKNKRLLLPTQIDFTIDEKTLKIIVEGDAVCNNMQTDGAAFEGWAMCLMAWLSEIISKVELDWSTPLDLEGNKKLHYRRFLYRVLRFTELYNWFSVSKNKQLEVNNFKKNLVGLQNNSFSEKPRLKRGKENNLSETVVEYYFAHELSELVKKSFDLDFVDRQFPVGVKQGKEQFFTGGMSAIDLWGTKGDKVTIIELKYNGTESTNIKVGIISELFIYSCIIRDILNGVISMPDNSPNENEMQFYEKSKEKKYTHIDARMLSDKYHPLLDNKLVIELMNHQDRRMDDVRITYYKNTYKLLDIK